jgi:hypothetical protein
MKKILYLSLLLFVCTAKAQESIVYKMKYLSDHSYSGIVTMVMKCNVNLSGDEQVLSKLKEQGMTPPIAFNMNMKMTGATKTGAAGADKSFPFNMTYTFDELSMNVNGNNIPMPANAKTSANIFGHVAADGKLKADSVTGSKMKDTSEKKITQMMNAFQTKIKFPDQPMHVGDTFTQDMPLNLPMGGNNVPANSKAVYKLVSIANGNAYFDVVQSMDLSVPVKGNTLHINGTGSGKLVFDIKNSFPTDYKTIINLKVDGNINTLKIDATATLDMDYKNDIQ